MAINYQLSNSNTIIQFQYYSNYQTYLLILIEVGIYGATDNVIYESTYFGSPNNVFVALPNNKIIPIQYRSCPKFLKKNMLGSW